MTTTARTRDTTATTTTSTTSTTVYTPREAILYSAQLLKKTISVQGIVVLADEDLGRVDISHQGAKLIVRMPTPATSMPKLQSEIVVTGILKKEQRRTFLIGKKSTIVCLSAFQQSSHALLDKRRLILATTQNETQLASILVGQET